MKKSPCNKGLKQLGLQPINADKCIYIFQDQQSKVIASVYVEGLIIATNRIELFKKIKNDLNKNFEMKSSGSLKFCLVIEFYQDPITRYVIIQQNRCIQDVLKCFGMEESKPACTQLEAKGHW